MKITNLATRFASRLKGWRRFGRTVAGGAAILAGGLLFAGSASAIEAIENGSFEDASPTGWSSGFGTYSHTTQVFYGGPAPAGAGVVYGWDPGIDPNGSITTQTINLSGGIAQVDAGTAAYDFSAWLASWTGDTDYTLLTLEWNDSASGTGSQVGSTITFDGNDGLSANLVGSADGAGLPDAGVAWTQDNFSLYQSTGNIPVGARSAVIAYDGETVSDNGNDAYLDLVSLDLPFSTLPPVLQASIDRDSGSISIENGTGLSQDIKGYSILSSAGALIEANYTPLADSDTDWIQFTASGATGDLSEGHLTTDSIADAASIALDNGTDGAWLQYFDESDITFEYLDGNGDLIQGLVNFTGTTQTESFPQGDLNFDGAVDGLDWLAYVGNLGNTFADQSDAEAYRDGDFDNNGINNHPDFQAFKGFFDAANGPGALDSLISGGSVPEPSTFVLLACAGIGLVCLRGRTRS